MQSRPCRTRPRTGTQRSTLSAPACAQAPDDASADDEAVRALLGTQFERGDAEDYVQLKDVAALLEAHHPDCHARLCLKAGTRVPSNEALAAAPDGARERGSVEAGAVLRVPAVTLCGWRWVAPPAVRGPLSGLLVCTDIAARGRLDTSRAFAFARSASLNLASSAAH